MDAALLTAGISAALAAASYIATPGKGPSRASARQGRRSKSRRVASSNPSGMNPTKRSDLRVRPPTLLDVPKNIPRNIPGVMFWDTLKLTSVITGGATPVESNFQWSLSLHPQVASLQALFDQYCIVQASVRFESLLPPASTGAPGVLFTALDFDNGNAIGSITAIEDYATCEEQVMHQFASHLRSINPCVKITANNTTTLVGALASRQWCDSAFPTVPHYCIRSFLSAGNTEAINVTQTLVFAFRNQI